MSQALVQLLFVDSTLKRDKLQRDFISCNGGLKFNLIDRFCLYSVEQLEGI